MISSTPHSDTYLSVHELSKRYGEYEAVRSTSLELRRGEMVGFLGPSGCGKTTTLRMLAGLITPTAGRITLDGQDVTARPIHKRNIGLVFQSYALFPHMNVEQNIGYGLRMRRLAKPDIAKRVAEVVSMVELGGLETRRPRELSGGQQQRVALARAVVTNPALLLLDEPLSNLDARLRDGLRAELRSLQQRLAMTAIFVTHDQVEALSICDRVAVMNNGAIEQVDTPTAIYERPATPFVASFVGRINKLRGRGRDDGGLDTPIGIVRPAAAVAPGAEMQVLFRPHRVKLVEGPRRSEQNNGAAGKIARVTFVGDMVHYDVAVEGGNITAERTTQSGEPILSVGTDVALTWASSDTLAFPEAS